MCLMACGGGLTSPRPFIQIQRVGESHKQANKLRGERSYVLSLFSKSEKGIKDQKQRTIFNYILHFVHTRSINVRIF
jgi:hypothetical protein